jgi:hypothetical protein
MNKEKEKDKTSYGPATNLFGPPEETPRAAPPGQPPTAMPRPRSLLRLCLWRWVQAVRSLLNGFLRAWRARRRNSRRFDRGFRWRFAPRPGYKDLNASASGPIFSREPLTTTNGEGAECRLRRRAGIPSNRRFGPSIGTGVAPRRCGAARRSFGRR